MKTLLALIALAVSLTAQAQGFDLVDKDSQVCKLENGVQTRCLPTLKSQGYQGNEVIEVVDQIKGYQNYLSAKKADPNTELTMEQYNNFAGAMLLEEKNLQGIVNAFQRLSVRNIAADPSKVIRRNGQLEIPFVARVFWKGTGLGLNGTLNIEGTIVLKQIAKDEFDAGISNNSIAELHASLKKALRLDTFSDSSTESHIEALRGLETAARNVHFSSIATNGQTVDEATLELLNEVVAPVVYGEVVFKPAMLSLIDGLTKGIEALGKAIQQL